MDMDGRVIFKLWCRRNLERKEKGREKASKAKKEKKKPEAWVTSQQHPRNKLKPRCNSPVMDLWIRVEIILWRLTCAVILFSAS